MEPLGSAFGQQLGTAEAKLEAKLRLEAGLEGRLEDKLRLEAGVEASGRGSKRQVELGSRFGSQRQGLKTVSLASAAFRTAGAAGHLGRTLC